MFGTHVEHRLAFRIKVEIVFQIDAFIKKEKYDTTDLSKLIESMANKAIERGKAKATEAYEEQVAHSLKKRGRRSSQKNGHRPRAPTFTTDLQRSQQKRRSQLHHGPDQSRHQALGHLVSGMGG